MTQSLPHDVPSSTEDPLRTALVLGGGGSAGNAWLIGVIAGLFDAGLDVSQADLIVGTSAGSTAAAQITGASPDSLLAETLATDVPQSRAGSPARPSPMTLTSRHLERTTSIIAASEDAEDMRRRMGAAFEADEAAQTPERSAQWRKTVAGRLPRQDWPCQRVLITAVDAQTGEPVLFDSESGVDLVDAVAASCAGGFAYRIGERRYIDGGYRTNADNADLAAGYARVLVLSPLGGRSLLPAEWGMHLDRQVEALEASGSRVETIFPDEASLSAFGDNMMNPATRPPAARAGYDQGRKRAAQLIDFWL